MTTRGLYYRLLIYGLLLTTFALGLPVFHYATALMIAAVVRYREAPGGLFATVELGAAPQRIRETT